MAWNESQIPTRTSRRQQRKSLNQFLNWAIGIVIVAIIFVGGYLLYSIMSSPPKMASHTKSTSNVNSTQNKNNSTLTNQAGSKTKGSQSSQSSVSNPSTSNASSSGTTASNSSSNMASSTGTSNGVYHFVGGGINGPWEPIGTIQSEPHTTNYDLGSIDWKERVKALLYATNINDNDYILWRLENGGAPNKSRGIISTKEASSKKYVVMLKWVTNQGWEPTSVTLESKSGSQGSGSSSSSSSDSSSTSNSSN